jgi:hypothetical protein
MSHQTRSSRPFIPPTTMVVAGRAARAAVLLSWSLCALTAGCASAPVPSARSSVQKNGSASDYFPLEAGWKWAYDLDRSGEHMLAVYQVMERVLDGAIVQAGDERLSYAVTPDGVAQKDGTVVGDFVLKNPIAPGAAWPVFAGSAKVVAVDQKISLPSGDYTGCVVVETLRHDPNRLSRTTFARGVGPVAIEVQVESQGRFVTTMRATLRGTTRPGVDPLALAAP